MHVHPAIASGLGLLVIVVGAIITLFTVVASIYWCIRPGETDPNHPKRNILRSDR